VGKETYNFLLFWRTNEIRDFSTGPKSRTYFFIELYNVCTFYFVIFLLRTIFLSLGLEMNVNQGQPHATNTAILNPNHMDILIVL